jgi:hypothetical protein
MARYFKYIILLTSSIFLLTSCQEGGDAGDLWGQWRMDGSDSKYISFSGSITMVKDVGITEVYGNFQHRGDNLYIQCFSKHGIPADTILVEQTFGFRPFTDIRLKIDRLDDDNLILSAGNQHWSFYKY